MTDDADVTRVRERPTLGEVLLFSLLLATFSLMWWAK